MKKSIILLIQFISIIPILSFGQINVINSTNGSVTITPQGLKGKIPINSSSSNVILGSEAAAFTTGINNIAIGEKALLYNTSREGNIAIGTNALIFAYNNTISSKSNNLAIGHSSLAGVNMGVPFNPDYQASINTGINNLSIGNNSLYQNSTGSRNTSIGHSAGYSNLSGIGNVFIGYNAGGINQTNNKLFIANSQTDNPLIKGDFSTGHLKINNKLRVGFGETPTATVDIAGDYALTSKNTINGSPFNNYDRAGSSVIKIQGQTVITGIAGGTDGVIVHIYLLPGADLELKPRSSLSLPENQIIWAGNINAPSITLLGGGSISLIYDGPAGAGSWRVLSVFKP